LHNGCDALGKIRFLEIAGRRVDRDLADIVEALPLRDLADCLVEDPFGQGTYESSFFDRRDEFRGQHLAQLGCFQRKSASAPA
jgi:hypothetical protein